MSFSEFALDSRLQHNIARAGFVTPTPIQSAAIPHALAGHDLIGTAQTGTGKTAAFVLPILQALLAGQPGRSRALIVTPTRELAEQINDTIRLMASGTRLRSATVYGGVGMEPQRRALRAGVDIIVACPGRLLDHVEQGNARLDGIQSLVLDEADRMLDMGFMPDVKRILSHLPQKRQTMLFSATFPKEIEQLASKSLNDPKRVTLGLSRPVQTVAHALYPVSNHLKGPLLLELLERTDTESVLVFTRTKHRAEKLAKQIERAGHTVTSLHSNRSQSQRQFALNGFRSGRYQIMVATDIAARGIDVETISHVINFDMPDSADSYIHRIGRTGRAERTGDAYTMITRDDESTIRQLERIMGAPLERKRLAGFDYNQPAPPRDPRDEQEERPSTGRPRRDDDRRSQGPGRRDDDRRSQGPSYRENSRTGDTTSKTWILKGDGQQKPFNRENKTRAHSAPDRAEARSEAPVFILRKNAEVKDEAPSFRERKNADTKSEGPAYGARKSTAWKTSFPKADGGPSNGGAAPWYAPYVNNNKTTHVKKARRPGGDR